MNAPQGTIEFGNIRNILYGSMTLSHGISPSAAIIYAAPQDLPYQRRAPLVFRYGGTLITLQDCILDSVDFQLGEDGHTRMVLSILDRRWKWRRFGWINGEYNTVEGDGTIRESRFKTPQQLARLCLDAMGERKYDVSQLPNDAFPEVDWNAVPAEMLSQLCEQFGCRVTLNPLTNRAQIVRIGVGQQLPRGFDVLSDDLAIDAPELPDQFVFRCGPTIRQVILELEPVLEDPDGAIRPIEESLLRPSHGWQNSLPPNLTDVAPQHRDLAAKNLFKLWRPKRLFRAIVESDKKSKSKKKSKKKPLFKARDIDNLELILPLGDKLPQTAPVDAKTRDASRFTVRERKPAVLFGDWHAFDEEHKEGAKILDTPAGKKQIWEVGFTIDKNSGLVMLSRPAILLRGEAAKETKDELTGETHECDVTKDRCNRKVFPAALALATGIGVRDADTFAWDRHTITFTPPGPKLGTQPYYITREDVFLREWESFRRDKSGEFKVRKFDNKKEIEKLARFYLDQALRQFQLTTPGSRTYAGFKAIALDGAVQQVSWALAQDGHARTTASRNTEMINVGVSYAERRFYERVNHQIASEAKGKERKPGEESSNP